ncbi:MAG: DEAD/DEAH box helicase [Caldicoprobacterales bacterium]|nr:DEAD/DEAH box helicase [Clostridiales bacterium]
MNLDQLVDQIRNSPDMMRNITYWKEIEPKEAKYGLFPAELRQELRNALKKKGINQLYSHQSKAVELSLKGHNIAVVTPTASGKTLCYNLPVINEILNNDDTRALYLFPTKALSQDQVSELHEIMDLLGHPIKTYTYDGDTPVSARKAIRQAGHIVVTNPDMLHSGIMPHHTKWVKLFENLKYIVIDEIHSYRGVFGSHLANVLRRLHRICRFYGSNPQFICCSATIANPKEIAERIIGQEVKLIDENGAPSGLKHLIFYNPPVVNKQLGIRRSSLLETKKLASMFLLNDIQTILFAKSRLSVEVLVTYLKQLVQDKLGKSRNVRGYRGGYLPSQRREIERGLRSGEILGVVSTNALELGIDIGRLQACIMCGYPGTIASTWQQAGRAGRRNDTSIAIMVASSNPLDQYVIQHPEFFLESSPEHGLLNPNNLYILLSHIKCAAFELPFEDDETFDIDGMEQILEFLEEEKVLRHVGNRWHWTADNFPASSISLRTAANENFIIIDITHPKHRVIGEVDRFSAPQLLHEEAVYIHEGIQYQVETLDFEEKKAYVRRVDVDYYTDANLAVTLKVLDVFQTKDDAGAGRSWGDVMVSSLVTMFKKIKFDTHENLGWGPVRLPELELQTTAYWMTLNEVPPGIDSQDDLQNGLMGIANVLGHTAPLYLMCDPRDIHVIYHVKSPFTQKPTIFIYDSIPGGIGFSEKLYELHLELFRKAREVISECFCENGCPACVGPAAEVSDRGKDLACRILGGILDDTQSEKQIEDNVIKLPFG